MSTDAMDHKSINWDDWIQLLKRRPPKIGRRLDRHGDLIDDVYMRTTINIHDDLMLRLKQEAHARGENLTTLINNLLRRQLMPDSEDGVPFRQRTAKLGVQPGMNLDKALHLASEMETEYALGKMELRK